MLGKFAVDHVSHVFDLHLLGIGLVGEFLVIQTLRDPVVYPYSGLDGS